MKHTLTIGVSKENANRGELTCRRRTVREKILRKLLGDPIRLTVLVPGETVEEVAIREVTGGKADETLRD
ncbi:hypothetical protein [Pseudoramibacter faecis]|uniref:hypothetical protein n=1 Tax=Pseudoramibacter faecis TaxID=3108534 RepID=UPI002E799C2E|nr:hypothetical protein [Pseudoramibacter sp. HA2172]